MILFKENLKINNKKKFKWISRKIFVLIKFGKWWWIIYKGINKGKIWSKVKILVRIFYLKIKWFFKDFEEN